jgi:hypothetical protein
MHDQCISSIHRQLITGLLGEDLKTKIKIEIVAAQDQALQTEENKNILCVYSTSLLRWRFNEKESIQT